MATAEASAYLSEYWQEQIAAWEQSGQSQKSFCDQRELNYHRFGYWRRKFLEQSQAGTVQQRNAFVPVQHFQADAVSGLSLTLPNGFVIQGIEQHNLPVVRELLQQL